MTIIGNGRMSLANHALKLLVLPHWIENSLNRRNEFALHGYERMLSVDEASGLTRAEDPFCGYEWI